jgi:hypothetical protein
MAVKEMIYLTVRDVLCDKDNEKASDLLSKYESCYKTKIIVHKAFYAISWIMHKKDNDVDFGYYWGVCGPFSDYVRLKLQEWIIPGLAGNRDLLKAKMPKNEGEPPLQEYYFNLKTTDDGNFLFHNIEQFYHLDESQMVNRHLYFELLASALYVFSATQDKIDMLRRLRVLKSGDIFDDAIVNESIDMFCERQHHIMNNLQRVV